MYFKFDLRNRLNQVKKVIEESDLAFSKDGKDDNNIDIYFPNMTKETSVFSTENANNIVRKILCDINKIWRDKEEKFEKVYFIGYSMGALLARKTYVCACACGKTNSIDIPLEAEFNGFDFKLSNQWAAKIDRIILLGGINRGWSINHHLSLFRSLLWSIIVGIGNVMMLFNKKPLVFSIRKGSSFVTQLRIQWIYMRKRTDSKKQELGKALTIQLLGSKDNLVSPEDNVDSITGRDFIYLEVPFSDHLNVVEIIDSKNKNKLDLDNHCRKRKDVFLSALIDDIATLEEKSSPLTAHTEIATISHKYSARNPDNVTDVIFVIHGIRDEGHWTNKVAQQVILENEKANKIRINQNRKTRHFEIETSRYGYFPMLLFALPWTRRKKLAWFMDQYAENLVLYPNATFSFIGHSNGTYLLAQALEKYQFCKFKRVVFAGSVVPKEYDWHKYIEREARVEFVLNYVATFDWVVAIFPNFLNLFQKDLGSAGHDGFDAGFENSIKTKNNKSEKVRNIKYIKGQHDAALNEYIWKAIAKFIVDDAPGLLNLAELQPNQISKYSRGINSNGKLRDNILEFCLEIVGRFPVIVWAIIILGLILIGAFILFQIPWGEWQKAVVFMVYLGLIWQVLTRI